ncbi:hypothetical protein SORBI_3005G166432 [Sorghum bicolor]|uniref:Uncharacterized protein n=1 Tax=Sorghum bicolor TaxID=4558 RepID=A0A1Z5RJ29_SORBI|nr:hypothetical protein SORBI_3005G166432 [Sorghum bicolor]
MLGGEMLLPTRCGDGKLSGDGGAEYPCVRRYRHRRLLTFLWLQGFQATHGSMVVSESDAMMWVPHLTHLVLHDQWQDATRYLSRFLPPADTCCRRPTSVEAMVLTGVCNAFRKLANIVVAGEEDHLSKHYLDHRRTIYDGQIRLRSIRLNVQQARASIDWERVKKKAAEVLEELAFATPELKDLILMPGGPMKPHNVLPIGFGFRRRCRPRKQTRKPKSAAGVAKSYLVRWRRLPASSDPSQETYDQKLTLINTLHRIADIILDECLKAGKLQVRPLQTTEKEGKLASHVPPTGAPLLQPVFSNLTSGCGNSGIGLMANAGAITAPLSQTMFGSLAGPVINPVVTSVEDAGALVAPASRNVFVTPGTPLANAGKLACHALTPGAQISSTVVGCLTSPAKNPELPLMSNAESGHQGLNISKNPREETTSCDEQDLHLKRQRTTGAFSHADGNLG